MAKRLFYRSALTIALVYLLVWLPLPGIPGACVSLKNVIVVLAGVLSLGKFLYDTLFYPRGPWGVRP